MKFDIALNMDGAGGIIMTFVNKAGVSSTWFGSPPLDIDHVGIGYLKGRFWNVRDVRHERFIKEQYKEKIGLFLEVLADDDF